MLQNFNKRLMLNDALGNDGGKRLNRSISIRCLACFVWSKSTGTCARGLGPSSTRPYQFPGIRPYARCISATKRVLSAAQWQVKKHKILQSMRQNRGAIQTWEIKDAGMRA